MSEVFIVRKKERCSKKVLMVESYFFIRAGAGVGAGASEKNTRRTGSAPLVVTMLIVVMLDQLSWWLL